MNNNAWTPAIGLSAAKRWPYLSASFCVRRQSGFRFFLDTQLEQILG